MPTNSGPTDLIQQSFDILEGDNQDVRITCQASARVGGGVAQWDGTLYGVTGRNSEHPEMILSRMRPAGQPVESGARDHMYIDFDRIIEIQEI